MKSQIGLIGLSTMGANLARNIANHNFKISVFNRTTTVTDKFIENFGSDYISGFNNLEDFVNSIEQPRKIIIMVKAGNPVDLVIESLLKFIDKEDIIIDCGNSNFEDTIRREKYLSEQNINFLGCGVSGGEEGALKGPSLMPGGKRETYNQVAEIFESIAAKDFTENPCVTYLSTDGAGHYVKMVHNGIEYGIMQLMAESYDILRKVYKLQADEISYIFEKLNNGKLKSYLFEISIPILRRRDKNNSFLIDNILDSAGQKGTGKWTAIDSLKRGISVSIISEAVFARITSSFKEKRVELNKLYPKTDKKPEIELNEFITILENALFSGMLISYAQGFDLISQAAIEQGWEINMSEVSRIWQGGCIIRAKILKLLEQYFKENQNHLFQVKEFKITDYELRKLVTLGLNHNISLPSFFASISYFDAMTSINSPANFIQALRDYFGAHTFKRIDKEGVFHEDNWNE